MIKPKDCLHYEICKFQDDCLCPLECGSYIYIDLLQISDVLDKLKTCGNCNNDNEKDCDNAIRVKYHHSRCQNWESEYSFIDIFIEDMNI